MPWTVCMWLAFRQAGSTDKVRRRRTVDSKYRGWKLMLETAVRHASFCG